MAVNLTSLQVMQDAPVIPVIVLNDVAHAVPMARALLAGGIRMLEITLRTPQALACMEAIANEVEGAVVGAGTRLHPGSGPSLQRFGLALVARCGHRQRNHDGPRGRLHRTQILPRHAGGRPRHAQGLERPVL